jgi:hypothetical protein
MSHFFALSLHSYWDLFHFDILFYWIIDTPFNKTHNSINWVTPTNREFFINEVVIAWLHERCRSN